MDHTCRNWPQWLPRLLWLHRKCPRCNSVKFKEAELRSVRRIAQHVCHTSNSLHVLLATVLLVCLAQCDRRIM